MCVCRDEACSVNKVRKVSGGLQSFLGLTGTRGMWLSLSLLTNLTGKRAASVCRGGLKISLPVNLRGT